MRSGVENPHLPEVTDFAQADSMQAKARPTRGQVTGARGRCYSHGGAGGRPGAAQSQPRALWPQTELRDPFQTRGDLGQEGLPRAAASGNLGKGGLGTRLERCRARQPSSRPRGRDQRASTLPVPMSPRRHQKPLHPPPRSANPSRLPSPRPINYLVPFTERPCEWPPATQHVEEKPADSLSPVSWIGGREGHPLGQWPHRHPLCICGDPGPCPGRVCGHSGQPSGARRGFLPEVPRGER